MKIRSTEILQSNLRAVIFLSLLVPGVTAVCLIGLTGKKRAPAVAAQADSTIVDFTSDEYKAHVEELKKKLPNKDFTVIVQPPFVVIGNEPPGRVKEHSLQTVKWAVDRLKQNYFKKDPKEILDIWLFKDKASYEKYAKEIYNDTPGTPYGYYSPKNKALIMNIGTGGGTLVHEIVHPFIEANFPDCPSWFNEGLASLYEQSGEVEGRIHGFTNWRLPGLQAAIKKRQNPSFKTLLSTTTEEFYDDESGVYYAQARYLCYYLQQKKLLVKFYEEFTKNAAKDPTGYATLQRVLGERDMNAFQKNWEAFVLKLQVGFNVEVSD